MKFILFAFALLLQSCSMLDLKDPEEMAKHTYRKTLRFEVDGKEYIGTAALPRKPCYTFVINPEEKMTYYLFQTVHRNVPVDKPKTGWFSKKFTYQYCPNVGIEDHGMALEIAALKAEQKTDAFAYIVFEDARPEVSLKATLKCNGEFINKNGPSMQSGVSLCQSSRNTVQEITFLSQTLIGDVGGRCNKPESDDGFKWHIKLSQGECNYAFVAREKASNGERLTHHLVTVGYSRIGVE